MKKKNGSKKSTEEDLKGNIIKYKKEIIIGGILIVAVIIGIIFLVVNSKDEENTNNDQNNNVSENTDINIEYEKVTEEQIIDVYGVTKEEAISLIKQNFNSDNFEYSASISSEGKYIVVAKNTVTNKEYKFEVDPATKQYYEI